MITDTRYGPQQREHYYVSLQNERDRKYYRDPVSQSNGLATVPMGRGFKTYARFHGSGDVVWVTIDGKEHWLSRTQADILDLALSLIDVPQVKIRAMALTLKVSPSTVSRALVKLTALGLIITMHGRRGRYAALGIYRRMGKDDGLHRFQEEARAKVKRWKEVALARLSRLRINVATYNHGREDESKYLQLVTLGSTYTLERNIKSEPWTAEDMAGVV